MRYKRLNLSAIFLLGLGLIGLHAQEVLTTAGGNASGSGGSSSYSVGQVFYTINTGTNGSIIQGVQQPYEISVVTALDEFRDISLQSIAYPNPTTDLVKLKVENFNKVKLSFQLYDMNGKLLISKKIVSTETDIQMRDLAPSFYYLKVIANSNEIKTFKIIKN